MANLYSVQGYMASHAQDMKEIYTTMYGEDEQEVNVAMGITGVGTYRQIASEEVKTYVSDIKSEKYVKLVTDPVTQIDTKTFINKYEFTEDTKMAKILGHKMPNFKLTQDYSNELTKLLESRVEFTNQTTNVVTPAFSFEDFKLVAPGKKKWQFKRDGNGKKIPILKQHKTKNKMVRTGWEKERINLTPDITFEGKEGFLQLLEKDPHYLKEFLSQNASWYEETGNQELFAWLQSKSIELGGDEESYNVTISRLLDDLPDQAGEGKMSEIGGFLSTASIIKGVYDMSRAKTAEEKKKATLDVAMNTLSFLAPVTRPFVGAFTVAKNLSEFFSGGGRQSYS